MARLRLGRLCIDMDDGSAEDEDGPDDCGVIMLTGTSAAFRMIVKEVRTLALIPRFMAVDVDMAERAVSTSSAVSAAAVVKCSVKSIPMYLHNAISVGSGTDAYLKKLTIDPWSTNV